MSGFIILSGFFANTGKTPGQFLKTWLGILAPYLVFESLYYLALSHLPASVPASNRLDPAFPAFWKALLLAPAGTYWYLYLLAVCQPVYYAVSRIPRLSPPARLVVCAALLAAVSWFNPAFQIIHAAYFLLGAFFRMTGLPILKCFFPTLWAAVPAAALASFSPSPAGTACWGSASHAHAQLSGKNLRFRRQGHPGTVRLPGQEFPVHRHLFPRLHAPVQAAGTGAGL